MKRRTASCAGVGILAALVLAGCNPAASTRAEQASTQCVDLPDNGYYLFSNGKFSPVSEVDYKPASDLTLDERLSREFASRGYPWLGVVTNDHIATLVGLAPDEAERERGFLAGEKTISEAGAETQQIKVIVDGISVSGGDSGVGVAIRNLDDRPTLEACQQAFDSIMTGRVVEFQTNDAAISSSSARLLDTITAASLLCKDYVIEVSGHTDARGSDSYNLALSQARASAVRRYLISGGVDDRMITAIGYGETRPIDPSSTTQAHLLNSRTEFKIREP
ncbi:MAG: OmpA family protein [Henriciella sp.]|nr:OmpA family protein [Henriciella sp.]